MTDNNPNVLSKATELIEQMDISEKKTYYEVPPCPDCGQGCTRKARKGVWEHCNYSIPIPTWDAINLHATMMAHILANGGIKSVQYFGHPLTVKEAVRPTMLLPLFIQAAVELGETINKPALLGVLPTPEELDNTGALLLPCYVSVHDTTCAPPDSLILCGAAALEAVRRFRDHDPTGTVMSAAFIYDVAKIAAAA